MDHETSSRIYSTFVRHIVDGQRSPSPWEALIRLLAQAENLPLDRFDNASQILKFYYPVDCSRAWSCVDGDHCAARGEHALALAKFELTFEPARIECVARREEAINCITSYLKLGRSGDWLWEVLVERVQAIAHLAADGKERIARWYACGALRAYYPYIRGGKYWDKIPDDYAWHACHILELIRFEYTFTREHRAANELLRERQIADRFASRLRDDTDRHICATILNTSPSAYSSVIVPNVDGVYARFREAEDVLPMYVGMGNLEGAMRVRHRRYSGSNEIYLIWFKDRDCKIRERKLLSVFDPPENSHHCVKHPDQLPTWFL